MVEVKRLLPEKCPNCNRLLDIPKERKYYNAKTREITQVWIPVFDVWENLPPE